MDGWQSLVGFHEARMSSFELHGAWAGRVTGCGQPGFYLVERGNLVVTLGGERYRVGAGDLLLIPRSSDHVLSSLPSTSQQGAAVVPIEDITARARPRGQTLVVGDGSEGLQVRSVGFLGPKLAFSWLPPALVLNGSTGPSALRHMTLALMEEVRRGTHAALCPLSEAVFVAALDGAVQAAHLDMELLLAMNQARLAPEEFASVSALARAAGLSRSRLSERFTLAFGEPPMRWLRRSRMEAARAALVAGRSSVAQLAGRFGYSSESAFRKAYRRALGEPATVRRNKGRHGG